MARDLPLELEDALADNPVRPFLAVRIELPDPVYAFTGVGLLTFDDNDGNSRGWIGAGEVAAIDTIGESSDGSATGVKVGLFQVPAKFRADIAQQAVRGATFEVYVGALDESYGRVLATKLIWKGRVAEYKITDNGKSISVEVSGESRAIDKRRPAIKRFTDEYQQRKHPGDRYLEYVSQMPEISILWAQAEQTGGAGGASGGGGWLGGGTGGFILGGVNRS